MSTSSQAGWVAKQGLSMLYNATVTSVSAISSGINMAYKSYSDHYEKSQIESLRKGAKPPADILYAVLMRFYYLGMGGYDNEVAAAAQKVAAKLTAGEKSSVTLESVAALSSVLMSTCSKYGDTNSSGWGLQDFLNSARMGKDHFDRDTLVNDCYFAILYAQDVAGGPGVEFDRIIREASMRMVEGDAYVSESPSGYGAAGAYTPSAYQSTAGLPSYAKVPAFGSGSVPSASKPASSSAGSGLSDQDPKKRAAKVLSVLTAAIKKAADEADSRRIRTLKEAEEMLQREKAKAAGLGAVPSVGAYGGGGSSSFGGGAAPAAGGSGFGGSAPAYGGPASAAGGSSGGFGGFGGGAKPAAPSGFGSGSSFGSGGGSGFGGATNSGYNSLGSTGGTGGAANKTGQPNWMGL